MVGRCFHVLECLGLLLVTAPAALGQGIGLPTRSGHWIDHLEPTSFAQRNDVAPLAVFGTGFINPTSCPARVELQNLAQGTVSALPADIESATKITAVIPAAIASTPGVYAVTVRFYTACGYGVIEESRLSNAARLEIIRTDYSAPETTIVLAPSGSASGSAVFEFSGSDDFTLPDRLTFQCRLDGEAPFACSRRAEFGNLATGRHTLEARALDQAGNLDTSPATHSWDVWSGVTDTAITSGPANNSSTRETSATFTFTGSDDQTPPERLSFECSLDTINFTPCSSPQTYTNLTSLGHLFRVRSKDEHGNVDATPASVVWYVDVVAPDTQIQGGPAGRETRTTATLVFTSTDNFNLSITYECKLDDGPYEPCTSPKVYKGLGTGSHTFWVRARDAAGNVDESPAARTWTIGR
ncbi:MAG TPA: hypothetical protein VNN18_11150 [Candidatus Xenobia bacterium]|nr:hypothetical protein [Candidatus Xenobia bacterium]